jgi:hypothetical protein
MRLSLARGHCRAPRTTRSRVRAEGPSSWRLGNRDHRDGSRWSEAAIRAEI